MKYALLLSVCALAGACSETSQPETSPPPGTGSDLATGTRPAGQPQLATVEGRVEEGVECDILRTPDGEEWAVNFGEADFGPGDYIRLTGEVADASFCMEGEGTLIPQTIDEIDPPARDRDPARAGGIALTEDYVIGSWVAKGVDADCAKPDIDINKSPGAIVMESAVSGIPTDSRVVLGDDPRLDLDDPLPDLPLESRGPDGLAILPSPQARPNDPISIAGHTIDGAGVVFVKCADS